MFTLPLLLALAAGSDPPAPDAPAQIVAGTVTDTANRPLPGVVVIALDPARETIVRMASADERGQVRMPLPPRSHLFGVMSASYAVDHLVIRGAADFVLVLRPLPGPAGAPPARGTEAPVFRSARAVLVHGRVIDESGQGLAGVRVDGLRATDWSPDEQGQMRASGVVVSSAISRPDGVFVLALPAGDTQIQARAPGLQLVRSSVRPSEQPGRTGHVALVMGIDAQVQTIVIRQGHTLHIRIQDSIDPEYTPPAAVKAWLQYAYGICPTTAPLTAQQRRALKKYWYLDVLRREPPNPASVSASDCVPAHGYTSAPLAARAGFGAVAGFDIVNDP
jgi:hypothetical protein